MSRLYVGRLPRDVRERDIERLFKGYGQIRDICLLSGFGFVEFRERRDAEDVMHDFHNREFMGERLLIEPARVDRRRERPDRGFGGPGGGGYEGGPGFGGGPGRRDDRGDDRGRRMGSSSAPQRTPYRMLVENLSSSVSWQDLKDFARRAGEVSFADAHKLRPGEGIVEFFDESGLRTALRKLDGEDLRGRRVVLREDTGSRSGGYGGGGRPPRDRSFSPRRGGPRDRSFSPRRSRSRSGSPGFRRASYRSRSPAGRRMSPGRRPSSRSRSPPPMRSRSPVDTQGLPPPPHQPMGRSSMSPRSPDLAMAGEPEPHAENGADMSAWE
ncbi:Serine/arginine-rich splicing factor 6 [Coemansia sp. BCRC 34301]|nr:Serine/arginine-rich splicing factor 6 [Coemansia sp. BCRC 34301]